MAWHRLRGNKSSSSGDVHIGLGISSQITPDRGEVGGQWDSPVCWSAVGGRMVDGELTRRRKMTSAEIGEWGSWLAEWSCRGRSVTVWGWGIGRALILLGLPAMIEAGELRISWDSIPRKRKDGSYPPSKIERGLLVLDDPPTILQFRHAGGARVEFRDLRNYFRHAGPEMAEHVGCHRPRCAGIADDYTLHESSARDWAQYALQSALSLIGWVRENDLGMLRSTIAGQALAAYRHRGMKHEIVMHDVADVQALERAGYFGGQTEVFFRGKITAPTEYDKTIDPDTLPKWSKIKFGPVFRYDINGFFPSIMSSGMFPRKLIAWGDFGGNKSQGVECLDGGCIADVLINTGDRTYPLRHGGFTYYPHGEYWTTLAGDELRDALEHGHVQSVRRWARYDLAPIFCEWMNELWGHRTAAKVMGWRIESDLWKALSNCLYGKFAQLSPEWIDAPEIDLGIPWGKATTIDRVSGSIGEYRSICWRAQRRQERGPRAGSMIAIAAFVTAAARMKITGIRRSMPKGSVYYQGIDSLHVGPAGARWLDESNWVSKTLPGYFKLEGEAESARYFGRADYEFGDERVFAGAKAEAHWEGQRVFTQTVSDRLEATLVRGPGGGVQVRTLTMRGGDSYRYGIEDANGWVHPHVWPLVDQPSSWSDCTSSCAARDDIYTDSSPASGSPLA